jgi:arylsulfatase A-like enzyme
MGDDVGWFNIGAYHRGMKSGKTPNLDKLAAEGMMFTDYYAEASCTAGRANFITGELPIRTGLTTVGQAGADVGTPDAAVTLRYGRMLQLAFTFYRGSAGARLRQSGRAGPRRAKGGARRHHRRGA